MTASTVRRIVIAVSVAGIAGMIGGSIADNNALAMTFGIVAAVASLCLMVATAVTAGETKPGAPGRPEVDEAQAATVEALVGDLVAQGADEQVVRRLVGEAVRLGRGR